MDKDLSRHFATIAFKTSSAFTSLAPLLNEHRSRAEYESYAKAIAAVSYKVHTEILNKIFSSHPELEKEIEDKIKKYGELLF